MITVENLKTKRLPEELSEFIQSVFDDIRANEDVRKEARLRRSPFKELIEETYPLSVFCNLKYKKRSVKCYSVIGNQAYDAIIEDEEGELVEVVEVTWPIEGQKVHFQAVQLNSSRGYTDIEVWDIHDDKNRLETCSRIIDAASKKSVKDYSTSKGSSLVFVIDTAPYFGMAEIEYPEDIRRLKQQLKKIEYRVNSVYLLLLPVNELVCIK